MPAAYEVLASYDNNQVGQLVAAGGDAGTLERREFSDAANHGHRARLPPGLGGRSMMVLVWNLAKTRPTPRVYDPRFFFPQWDNENEDFSSCLHLAWELSADDETG
ncbi:hypothetical protein ACIRQQ_43235 [Streptomyces fuscichromogenes]|uniref:hypothetical protein n=1 Tax=Streptomyces fuscichromogenes TaxID=1324013 RepID=UPI00380F5DEF